MNITTKQLKDMWIKFYESKNHKRIDSSSVVPVNDNTVLFTTAGMQPLVPYLLGEKHEKGTRLVNYQACIRTNDIESVGNSSHLTFFEMLGRWSLGDYDKVEAIKMSFEFLTSKDYLNIPLNRLAISVFAGNDKIEKDTVAYNTWLSLGVPAENIFYLPESENWWALGETGPCGTDSEMFYIAKPELRTDANTPADDSGVFLEIGNDVFMSFNKNEQGELIELENKNIDTGLGLERNVAVLNGLDSVYQTDAFSGTINTIEQLTGKKYGQSDNITRAIRVVADHIRTSTMILGDVNTTTPSNAGRGYVLRRLIRRSVRFARELELDNLEDLTKVSEVYIKQLSEYYPNLQKKHDFILNELKGEINKFSKTLASGLKELEKVLEKLDSDVLDGATAFRLYDTYGFPIEITTEILKDHGKQVDLDGYHKHYKEHQEKSRGGGAQMFKGGLAGDSEIHKRYHTATHLLHAVLRSKFGEHAVQAGSNITDERMRFDFVFDRKLTPEEIAEVQNEVNDLINQNIAVERLELTKDEAFAMGAFGLFTDKYGENVTVYKIGDKSIEFCGGPHVENTGEIGEFIITKESSSSAGVRRIRAIIK